MSKIMYNDRPYGEIIGGGGLGGGVVLTQAEYDALDQEEKDKDIIYFITDGNSDLAVVNDSVPIGSIQAYAGTIPPGNWLVCGGQAVSRIKYQQLFGIIGTTYGEGDGSTTFNLPDFRGRVAIGSGLGTAKDAAERVMGQIGGSERVTLTIAQMPSHNHGELTDMLISGYSGWPTKTSTKYGLIYDSSAMTNTGRTSTTFHYNEIETSNTGGGEAHGNMQPYLTVNYIIKAFESSVVEKEKLSFLDLFYPVGSYYETSVADFDPNTTWGGTWVLETSGQVHVSAGTGYTIGATGGSATVTLTANEIPSHSHSIIQASSGNGSNIVPNQASNPPASGDTLVQAYQAGSGWIASNSQYVGQGAWNAQTKSAGSSQAHNNMQPYIVVNRWHRTA